VPRPEQQVKSKKQKLEAGRQKLHERRRKDEIVAKASLLGHKKGPQKLQMQVFIRNRVESCSSSVPYASLKLMHIVRETYH
jgi:hypothetical protein